MPSQIRRRLGIHRPGNIGCTRVLIKLQRYLDGEIDQRTSAKILTHLETCDRCGLKAEAYAIIKNSLEKRRSVESAEVDPMVARLQSFATDLMADHDAK
jgi:anti-sigma factor RsiW